MIVLLAILTPSILRYVENSRMQKDDSAMDEVCHGILYALSDSEIFDEAVSYSIPNNYVTYTDSSGVYGAKYTDEEFWAPDGSGEAVTITFNPDENGTYTLANGLVNDMTYGNGSVADSRTAEGVKQCYFSEMGQQKLYHKVEQTIGSTFSEKSATYNNSSYTVFITFDVVNGIKRADVYGEWNGTNLDPSCPASLGSGTNSYTEEEEPEQTKTGGTTQSNYTSSDLQGGGGTSGNTPSYKNYLPCGHLYGTEGDHSELGCKHYACEDCECVPASCGVEGHYEGDGMDHTTKVNHTGWNSLVSAAYANPHTYACQCDGWIVPEGGTYKIYKTGQTYNAGEQLPCGCYAKQYDTYIEGDYKYTVTYDNIHLNNYEWGVTVIDKTKSSYGPLRQTINGRDLMFVRSTFQNCTNLTEIPVIPDSVIDMYGTFMNCSALVDAGDLQIPNGVVNLHGTFYGCSSLLYVPNINHLTGLYTMHGMFQGCTSLRNVESLTIPETVKQMSHIFQKCTSLTGTVKINATPQTYTQCFDGVDFKAQQLTLIGSSPLLDEIGRVNSRNYCSTCNGVCQNNH